jgi:hypothetical protein
MEGESDLDYLRQQRELLMAERAEKERQLGKLMKATAKSEAKVYGFSNRFMLKS